MVPRSVEQGLRVVDPTTETTASSDVQVQIEAFPRGGQNHRLRSHECSGKEGVA